MGNALILTYPIKYGYTKDCVKLERWYPFVFCDMRNQTECQ